MEKRYSFNEIKNKLLFDGRLLYEEDCVVLGWEGSGFEFQGEFSGKITMDVVCSSPFYYDKFYYPSLYFVIDGVPHRTELLKDDVTSVTVGDVTPGYHYIKVIKNSQSIFNTIRVKGLVFDGEIHDAPAEKPLSIEFIGDSITAGSVVMSYESDPPDLEIDNSSDAYYFYPGVTCRALNAKMYDVSTGGIGLINCEGGFGTNADTIYEFTDVYHDREQKWDFSKVQPDVVVIAQGTNDLAYHQKQDEYRPYVVNYLKKIRRLNPNAYIYWIYGMMFHDFDATIKSVVEELNDGKMRYILMPSDNHGGYDHPGKAAHAEYGRILSEDIKKFVLKK